MSSEHVVSNFADSFYRPSSIEVGMQISRFRSLSRRRRLVETW